MLLYFGKLKILVNFSYMSPACTQTIILWTKKEDSLFSRQRNWEDSLLNQDHFHRNLSPPAVHRHICMLTLFAYICIEIQNEVDATIITGNEMS